MANTKKKDLTVDVLGSGALQKIAKKIKGRQYASENPEKTSKNKKPKSNTADSKKSKNKKPRKEVYQKTPEQGLEELRKLRAKQRKSNG